MKQDRETGGWEKRLVLLTRRDAKTQREVKGKKVNEGKQKKTGTQVAVTLAVLLRLLWQQRT